MKNVGSRIRGHLDGLSRLYDALIHTAELYADFELYPSIQTPSDELVKFWLLDVDRVMEPEQGDFEDPIRQALEMFWRRPNTEMLFYLLTDLTYDVVDIDIDDRDRFTLYLNKHYEDHELCI